MNPPTDVSRTSTWRHDVLASVVVFLVALPLCMGIAIASGVPAEKAAAVGLITGITGGIVVGLLAGSPLLVTGPAAGLSVIVYDLVQRHGWEMIGLIVLLAGALQMIAGLFKLGQWFRAVSPAVVHGMLAGIGVLICVSQFHIMLDDSPRKNGIENITAIPEAIWRGIASSDSAHQNMAAGIGVLTIGILIFWKKIVPDRIKIVPAPLVAVCVATLLSMALELPIKRVSIPENLATAITLPSLSGLSSWSAWQPLLIAALSIAFIASAETLLSASAVDQMHQGPRTRYDRELVAQGVGNMVSGFLGALPMTGVIVRSAANVQAGARTSKSEILHSIWLLMFVCLVPSVLRQIPTASLAGILVFTGFKLVDLKVVRELRKFGVGEVLIYSATVLVIVGADLLTGVIVGIVLSIIKLVVAFSHLTIRVDDDAQAERTIVYLEGTASFIRLPKLAAALDAVPANCELHVHIEQLDYIDHACLDLLMNWKKQHAVMGGSLVIDWEGLTARVHQRGRNGSSPSPVNQLSVRDEDGDASDDEGTSSHLRWHAQAS